MSETAGQLGCVLSIYHGSYVVTIVRYVIRKNTPRPADRSKVRLIMIQFLIYSHVTIDVPTQCVASYSL